MSAWLEHVKKTKKENPELFKKEKLKGILKLASKTYKKGSTSDSKKASKKHKPSGRVRKRGGAHSMEHDMNDHSDAPHKGGKKSKKNRKRSKKAGRKSRKTRRHKSKSK